MDALQQPLPHLALQCHDARPTYFGGVPGSAVNAIVA
jgi:hypothetical protein